MKFTIIGASGFIGSHLVTKLRGEGYEVDTPTRNSGADVRGSAGHVIYASGLTGDYRHHPFNTIDAHVTYLSSLLRSISYKSWLYLSSTRVYGGLKTSALASEDSLLNVTPSRDGLYDLSKLLGEALCLAQPQDNVRVARLSNVYGRGQSKSTFLGAVLDGLSTSSTVTIREAPLSSKDYVCIDDVIEILPIVAQSGQFRVYNVSSGEATTHLEIARGLEDVTGGVINFAPNAQTRRFPTIDISRLRNEFEFRPRNIIDDLQTLVMKDENDRYQA